MEAYSLVSHFHAAKTTDRAEARRIQVAAVTDHRERVAAIVERRVPAKHREVAAQAGYLGVLVALEHEPAPQVTFWDHAAPFVEAELARFLDVGIAWRAVRAEQKAPKNARLSENSAEREAFTRAFAAAPDLFTPAEREAVQAVYFQRRSVRDAAEQLGVSFGTLRDRIRCARMTLRNWLRRERAS